jgi:DNA polymerase gamma 1
VSSQTLLRRTLSQVLYYREMEARDRWSSPPASGKSKVLSLLGNSNGFPVLQSRSGHHRSRVSFIHSEWRSVEDVSKDSLLRQRVVTITFPRTLGQSLAQTARLDACGEPPRVHLSRPKCSGPSGIGSLQSQGRICHPEPSIVTPCTHIVPLLLQLSWQGWPFFYSCEHGWTYRIILYQVRRKQLERTRLR